MGTHVILAMLSFKTYSLFFLDHLSKIIPFCKIIYVI